MITLTGFSGSGRSRPASDVVDWKLSFNPQRLEQQ
jgi:hypothetical protein